MTQPAADAATMEKIVALCKRRGFIFASSEIYGGLGSTYDYGHYGVLLKTNVKNEWWRAMLQERDDIVALDSAILQHPRVWEASGHLAGFTDPMVDCRACKKRFRADHLDVEEMCPAKASLPKTEDRRHELTEARDFNLMFKTFVGPMEESASVAYLRPETAQGIFINFKNVLQFSRKKPPFGIAQVGKSFRNEITPGNFVFRTREFEQMEMEFFVPPDDALQWYETWKQARYDWYVGLGLREDHLRMREHDPDELSHYSSGTADVEYYFPIGWSELEGVANRGNFDLTQHAEYSGEKLEYFDPQTKERYVPHVIEPAAGADRATLAFLVDAYDEDDARRRVAHRPEAPPAPGAGQGRRPAAGQEGRPAGGRPRDRHGAARADADRVRRGRLDRQALPPPGRDRHAVLRHGRPPDAGGPDGDAARSRHARAGAAADRRARRGARGAAGAGVALAEGGRDRGLR